MNFIKNCFLMFLVFTFNFQSNLFCETNKKRKASEVFKEEAPKKKIKTAKKKVDLLKKQLENFDYKLDTKLKRSDLLRGQSSINYLNNIKKLCSSTIEKINRINNLSVNLKRALDKVRKYDEESFDDLKKTLRAFFATIPYYGQIRIQDSITLQLVLYMVFKASDICVSLGECKNNNDEDSKEQILIIQYDGKNYFISAKFFEERLLDDEDYDIEKEVYVSKNTKVERYKTKYKKINNNDGISFQINLYGDDTKYQEAFLARKEFEESEQTPYQVDSKLKFDIEKDFSDICISQDDKSSCDFSLIKKFLNILADGQIFRENEVEQIKEFKKNCQEFFLNFPYKISSEKGYHLVFYTIFMMNGFNSKIEQASSKGRSDLVIDVGGNIYIFEFKYSDIKYNISKAMKQMIIKRYSEIYGYEKSRDNIFGIAISFGSSGNTDIQVGKMPENKTPFKKNI